MPPIIRQAACDPCRTAKLACDHQRPKCQRCLASNKAAICVYRASPFRRRRRSKDSPLIRDTASQEPVESDVSTVITPPSHNRLPNPGHLGPSSHAAIFSHILQNAHSNQSASPQAELPSAVQYSSAPSVDLSFMIDRAAEQLKLLFEEFDLVHMKDLVNFWLAKGVSLALAEPIVHSCVDAMDRLHETLLLRRVNWHTASSQRLLRNSNRPLSYDDSSTLSIFTDQFCGHEIRWETLGIFLLAVIRAASDIPLFPSLYKSESERCKLQNLAIRLNNCSLELCLSLNALNDLQLIFQYESFIVCCTVDGDQSLRAWRSLGDVIATLFALGYHEDISSKSGVPPFLVEMRKTAFARIYSADKNVSIFLGRPPRMSKRFSFFQIPSGRADFQTQSSESQNGVQYWDVNAEVNYRAETRWSALCASLKEEILELIFNQDRSEHIRKTSQIMNRAKLQWDALPPHFRLSGSLKQCAQTPIVCDFLVSTRLNFLHVHFLLHLVMLDSLAAPDDAIVEIAQQILALVIEAILLREWLSNSGTTLVWKVVHYGLPAAGIILLSMLKRRELFESVRLSSSRVWRDLSILAAEVQMGTVVRPSEPNHAVLHKATGIIQTFLDSIASEEESGPIEITSTHQGVYATDETFSALSPDPWNLELGFWQNLAEHPFLSSADPVFQDL